jgi:YidC/Oxa1 family membrane protein insertase
VAAFGAFWHQFQRLIFGALLYLQGITHDWGMAIILLTVGIRVVLLPLTWKQTKSMVEMQRIQPQIKALQEKYKDDKEKLQEETMKFYSENKVNPFGGCLPLLLQFPILIALYGVLGQKAGPKVNGVATVKLGLMLQYLQDHGQVGTFYRIIPDISKTPQMVWATHNYVAAIPYLLLVILFAVSIWLPQALMPGDKQQKMIGGYMAIVMLWFGWVSPAGVLLYWDVSSIWGVAQQQITMSMTKRELEAAAPDESPSKKKVTAGSQEVAAKKPANKGSKKSKKS